MSKQEWQIKHEKKGYDVTMLSGGQVRSYGPTIYKYKVKDITGERTEKEIREYCTTNIRRADDPKKHDLANHLTIFTKNDDGSYLYVCRHEYTG